MIKLGRHHGYVIGILAALSSIGLTQLTWKVLGNVPFVWAVLMAQLVTLFIGWGPGMVCALLALVYVEWHFLPPPNMFTVGSLIRLTFLFTLLLLSAGIRFRYDHLDTAKRRSEDLINAVAHELLNPLTAALLAIQVHRMGAKLQLDVIEGAVRRAARLIDSMMEIARTKRGVEKRIETFDIVEELSVLGKLYCPSAVISAPRPIPITCNRTAVEHIFGNLFSNAKKYGGEQPIEVNVTLKMDKVTICIQDHGEGLTGEETKVMFEKYTKFNTSKPGLGLGLWIVAESVKAMDGQIEVRTSKDKGTCFEVSLPLKR
jgi:signal transduction histidine kinase